MLLFLPYLLEMLPCHTIVAQQHFVPNHCWQFSSHICLGAWKMFIFQYFSMTHLQNFCCFLFSFFKILNALLFPSLQNCYWFLCFSKIIGIISEIVSDSFLQALDQFCLGSDLHSIAYFMPVLGGNLIFKIYPRLNRLFIIKLALVKTDSRKG